MKIRIDLDRCCRSGECYYNHPELFAMGEGGEPVVLVSDVSGELALHAEQAAEVCPTFAITVEPADGSAGQPD
ncbi:MAG TPA: ferredoxin [Pseudomonadales bacterium]